MEVIPERGDIWSVVDPTLGSEIRKPRPCVVMSVKVLNDPDLLWRVTRCRVERPNPSGGKGTHAHSTQRRHLEEMAALEDGLRQIMQLG
ncbi:MAG: type II toxin-antitoxin system PemK/MazF family toxin [Bryobacteraceae bacterium]|nr:type II toxin-antitoxin system PemK/MazF family toxin [Bryobacteraceae bacterium]